VSEDGERAGCKEWTFAKSACLGKRSPIADWNSNLKETGLFVRRMPFMPDKSNTSNPIDTYVSWPEGDAMVTSKNARMLITRDGGDRALICFVCCSRKRPLLQAHK
jgi:hypothetical protein